MTTSFWLLFTGAIVLVVAGVWLAGLHSDRRRRRDAEAWRRRMGGRR
jgi:hypothetical protein